MKRCVGIDVAQEQCALCIVDDAGTTFLKARVQLILMKLFVPLLLKSTMWQSNRCRCVFGTDPETAPIQRHRLAGAYLETQ